ncbi:MAG: SDR family oxidoreductase [Candidatus Accumulibacter sp.]|jgi:NAD(P)-dependent dehydrogenase (short-subunit alcohol dehydrogenase family)|nr:SDR family oxidoreductase [Accumulibacter sp.]
MDLQLQDRHVLIGGGSKGIGLACASGFLDEGARVSLVSREAAHLEAARRTLLENHPGAEDCVAVFPADLRDAEAAAAAVEQAERQRGPVDILVNSAGAARRTPPDELTPRHWREAMDAKFFTYIHLIDPAIKRMAARGHGVILNVVGAGGKVAKPVHLPGGAANASLMLVSAGLAAAYGPRGIRVNAVNPGTTRTERMQAGLEVDARAYRISLEEALARASANVPLGRVAEPKEIADAVLFLCSSRASYITGAILSMDGAVTPLVV